MKAAGREFVQHTRHQRLIGDAFLGGLRLDIREVQRGHTDIHTSVLGQSGARVFAVSPERRLRGHAGFELTALVRGEHPFLVLVKSLHFSPLLP